MTLYDIPVVNQYGFDSTLASYRGKVLLIINSATKCGFTRQYDDLQDLYEKYGDEGFVVLDFPCNQFGGQAPGTTEEIVHFCDASFGITFPIFSKVEVNGPQASLLFAWLKQKQGFRPLDLKDPAAADFDRMLRGIDPDYDRNSDIKWNFTKFLVDRDGNVVQRFEPFEDMALVEERIRNLL